MAVLSARDAWTAPSDAGLAILRVAICAAWVARDLAYLQWVCLLQRSRSVLTGLLSLTVFYVGDRRDPSDRSIRAAARLCALWARSCPGPSCSRTRRTWRDDLWSWLLVFVLQLVLIAAFAFLQTEALKRFAPPPDTASTVPA